MVIAILSKIELYLYLCLPASQQSQTCLGSSLSTTNHRHFRFSNGKKRIFSMFETTACPCTERTCGTSFISRTLRHDIKQREQSNILHFAHGWPVSQLISLNKFTMKSGVHICAYEYAAVQLKDCLWSNANWLLGWMCKSERNLRLQMLGPRSTIFSAQFSTADGKKVDACHAIPIIRVS